MGVIATRPHCICYRAVIISSDCSGLDNIEIHVKHRELTWASAFLDLVLAKADIQAPGFLKNTCIASYHADMNTGLADNLTGIDITHIAGMRSWAFDDFAGQNGNMFRGASRGTPLYPLVGSNHVHAASLSFDHGVAEYKILQDAFDVFQGYTVCDMEKSIKVRACRRTHPW